MTTQMIDIATLIKAIADMPLWRDTYPDAECDDAGTLALTADQVRAARAVLFNLTAECEKIKAERDAIRRQAIKECGDTVHAEGVCQAHTEEAYLIALKIEEAVRGLAPPKENEQQASV